MTSDILKKLKKELVTGIATEAQVVYFMAGIRKLLEQQQATKQYEHLKFHCDWTLHSRLEGSMAQKVLRQFDLANLQLKTGVSMENLPRDLAQEIRQISMMNLFQTELRHFLNANGLPPLEHKRADGWIYFLHLYARVIEDCPLVLTSKLSKSASIVSVTVHFELAKKPIRNEMFFKVTWTVLDKNGLSGDLSVFNSFSLNPS